MTITTRRPEARTYEPRLKTAPITVLVVDDHPPFLHGVTKLMQEQAGLDVIGTAENGQQAIDLAMDLHPDVVVMDVSLPGVNGIEATREIKSRLPDTVVLVLSAYGYHPYVEAALQAGANGYLLKTLPLRRLIDAVRAVYAGELVLEQAAARRAFSSLVSRGHEDSSPTDLTQNEIATLRLSARGLGNKEIAAELGVAVRTVQAYFANIFIKAGVRTPAQAVIRALQDGWLSLDDLA